MAFLRNAARTALMMLPALPAWAEPLTVTDIPPVASLVSMVSGSEAVVLLPPGTSAHTFSLKPSQARSLSQAALVVWIGPELTPALDRQIRALAPDAGTIALAHLEASLRLPFREGGLMPHDDHAEHGNEHADDHDAEEDSHANKADAFDPHLWLDPKNATLWLEAIAQALSDLDPDNAARYRANALTGAAAIATATEEARARLTPLEGRTIAVSHDAFQYFEHAFGLNVTAALSDGDDAAPGAARVAALRDRLAEQHPACILTEPGTDAALLASVAPETIPRAEIDVMGGTLPQGPALYPGLIADIAQRIADCADQ
ncbi:zinc ABC transporter substrate-binding protein [Sagittula salina]|uniref:High-affinity zinc uptake system protein ZnuA n=1 Tax=Sagittula salina TaxID=2820268 RepID=A0A940S255_9RHOB|nr:zinc ABC transporter substrate-binding protein [Sagittula salina]MBP0481280.1 zinc ABC transporter substrate-binding protein [Sagittula salina]